MYIHRRAKQIIGDNDSSSESITRQASKIKGSQRWFLCHKKKHGVRSQSQDALSEPKRNSSMKWQFESKEPKAFLMQPYRVSVPFKAIKRTVVRRREATGQTSGKKIGSGASVIGHQETFQASSVLC